MYVPQVFEYRVGDFERGTCFFQRSNKVCIGGALEKPFDPRQVEFLIPSALSDWISCSPAKVANGQMQLAAIKIQVICVNLEC